MVGIIIESLLFLALLAAAGMLVYTALVRLTPLGRRLAQARNRERIEAATGRTCLVHGYQEAHDLVRLPDGELICPQCYAEAMHAE